MTVFFALVFPTVLLIMLGQHPGLPGGDAGPRRPAGDRPVRADRSSRCAGHAGGQRPAGQCSPPTASAASCAGSPPRRSPPPALLAAQLVVNLAVTATAIALVLVVGRVAFDVPCPRSPPASWSPSCSRAAALFALGLLIAAVAPTAQDRRRHRDAAVLPDDVLRRALDAARGDAGVAAADQRLHAAGRGRRGRCRAPRQGDWPRALHLAVLLGYTLVFAAAARRLFRWE